MKEELHLGPFLFQSNRPLRGHEEIFDFDVSEGH